MMIMNHHVFFLGGSLYEVDTNFALDLLYPTRYIPFDRTVFGCLDFYFWIVRRCNTLTVLNDGYVLYGTTNVTTTRNVMKYDAL
jgi:hypothetical protein